MTDASENAFFATQINQADENEENDSAIETKEEQKQQNQVQVAQQEPVVVDGNQNAQKEKIDLRKLLQLFNSYDKGERGVITLQEGQKIINSFEHVANVSFQKIDLYYKLSLSSNDRKITFDQFLFVFGLCEFDIETKTIDEQYQYCRQADPRIIDFLRLLNNYRKKCQKQSVYQEAKKSKNKVEEVRSREYERRKNFLSLIHKKQLESIEDQQKQKFVQFCTTWDEFMNEYEHTAAELIKRLGQKQQDELRNFIQKTKEQLASKVRFSKKVVELQDLEKRLVKSQQYEKAQKIMIEIQQSKIFELHKKEREDLSTLELRAQTVRKQQTASMNTLLQKIQKDRNDQSKQRMSDSEKLIVKSKALVTQVKHRHADALKKLYQALHNVTIDEARLISNMQSEERTKSNFNQSMRQKN